MERYKLPDENKYIANFVPHLPKKLRDEIREQIVYSEKSLCGTFDYSNQEQYEQAAQIIEDFVEELNNGAEFDKSRLAKRLENYEINSELV